MVGEELTDNFIKDKFPVEESVPQEKVLDIYEFDDLIESYKEAQMGESFLARMNTRRALKEAYRAALRAAGRSDR
jgi:hypothetical protein